MSSVVNAAPPIRVTISPASLSIGIGLTQQFTAQVSRATNTSVVWSVNGINGGNATVGTITSGGLFTAPAAVPSPATVTVRATSVQDSSKSASAGVTITGPSTPAPMQITTSSLPDGTVGASYNTTMSVSGGTAPYSWSVASGQLPPGLSLGSPTILGTPTTAGLYSFTIRVTDSSGATQTSTANLSLNVANATTSSTLWAADHETGNTSQWDVGGGGGEFNSGTADTVASKERARSGSWGLKMTITTPPESGTRMFRWQESQRNAKLYYSAWYYFPQRYTVSQYWNIFQWKSKRSSSQVDPFFVLNVGNRSGGSMYLYLYDWQRRQSYTQSMRDIPVGQWFKIEAYYACAADGTGQVTFWQDGTQLFDVKGLSTRYSDGDCQWSVDNYSNGLSPSPATIYMDDAVITTGPSGGGTTAPPPPAPAPLSITTSSLPGGQAGTAYTATLAATGGTTPYAWSLAGGQLPPGLSLSAQGQISGIPSSAGTYSVSFRVTDAAAQTSTSSFLNIAVATPPPSAPTGTVLWSADMETGDTSQWYAPSTGPTGSYGGGEYNSGSADTVASRDFSRSGQWGLKMTITTPPESGTRMFRWKESQTYPTLRYSAWYYIPQRVTVAQYWNIFQWKSKRSSTQVDPFFVLNIGNRSNGAMYLYLRNWQKAQSFLQSTMDVPVGKWFQVEAEYSCASDNTGRVKFWQDGQLLFDLSGVQTRYSDGDCQWSVDNYSNGVSPSTATIYLDDAVITRP